MAQDTGKKNIMDAFIGGCKEGFKVATTSTIPYVMMAFVVIKILKQTGLLDLIGMVFEPIMAIFGLPGEASAVLMSALLSMGGAVGVAVGLFESGVLNARDLAILAPSIYLMGSTVQYSGRILGLIEIPKKYYAVMFGIAILNALIALFVMNIITGSYN